MSAIAIAARTCRAGWADFRAELRAYVFGGKLLAIGFLVLFMAYSTLKTTREAFKMTKCTPYSVAGHKYLLADLSVRCDSAAHDLGALLSYCVLGLVSAGLPCLFSWYLVRHEEDVRLGTSSPFFERLGFLFQGYPPPSS